MNRLVSLTLLELIFNHLILLITSEFET